MLIVDEHPVMETPGDELVCKWNGCRNKTVHAVGNTGKFNWVDLGGHNYTGIFDGGSTNGIVRFSTAAPVFTFPMKFIAPGMGVKFLRDGIDSANFVAMYSVDGQSDLNFFTNDWNTHIAKPGAQLKPLEARFATVTPWIQTIGLSDMASYDNNG